MLNNRESATLILVSAFALFALLRKSVREGSVEVVRAFLNPGILIALAAMLTWVGLALWVGVKLALRSSEPLSGVCGTPTYSRSTCLMPSSAAARPTAAPTLLNSSK